MKTPGEIKKGLGLCLDRWTPVRFVSCEPDCPYHSEGAGCKNAMHSDVIDYIQRLVETIENLGHLNKTMYDEAKNGIQELESRLAQVERERDAMHQDMKLYSRCKTCKRFVDGLDCPVHTECTYGGKGLFEWRGVCAENTEEARNESSPDS